MKKRTSAQHSMQGVFVFVLLGLFAMMSTLMVLLGAQMYRSTVDAADADNSARVLSAYVRSMIRAQDASGGVEVVQQGDITALALYEEISGDMYVTWIYSYEGQLYEWFTDIDYAFSPDQGTAICPVGEFAPEISNNLLTVSMTDEDDRDCTVQVALHGVG